MSNRFTKYTADKLRADGWLDKDQAATLRTRLQQVESERDEAEARNKEAERLLRLVHDVSVVDISDGSLKKSWFDRRDTFLNPKPQDVK